MLLAVTPDLRAVSAIPHVTPTAAMVFARVDEKPAAVVSAALSNMSHSVFRRKQGRC
jgi:hypothetical protein